MLGCKRTQVVIDILSQNLKTIKLSLSHLNAR